MPSYLDNFMDQSVNRYIQNAMPMRLLHLPEMRLMNRIEIKRQVGPRIRQHASEVYRKTGRFDDKTKELILRPLSYAILSHRWLDDNEPNFHHISSGTVDRSGPGFNKLLQFCTLALATYTCEWAWSDTCCIDKSSSAELDESIRSMFRWYKQAKVCLVYLGDTLTIEDVAKDQWFTRGWTLQELLAPKQIRFFDKNWAPLVTHRGEGESINSSISDTSSADFRRTVSTITNIPADDLVSFTPKTRRAREVLFWASKRSTTREEDEAYSLLGVLNVSIPVAYGEGERAFYRLQVEIANTSNEGNLFHWVGAPSEYGSAFARDLSCFSFFEETPKKGPILPIPRGARSFMVTNEGLRIRLPLYPVERVLGDRWAGTRRIIVVKADGLPDIKVSDPDEMGPSAERIKMVGILDFDHDDTAIPHCDGDRDIAESRIMGHIKEHGGGYPDHKVARSAAAHLIGTRKDRLYTAILLEPYEDFSSDSYIRVKSEETIRVKRPKAGWKALEDVYLR